MRIGLLSDTHIPSDARELPPQVKEVFRGVDLILHAGDIYLVSVLDELECIAPTLAAMGDDDPMATIGADHRTKGKHVLKLGNQTLWLTHERPYIDMISLQQREHNPDIVVFGHTHHTLVQRYGGVLYVNPGSPTFLNYRVGLGTVGILDIESGKAEADIIQLN